MKVTEEEFITAWAKAARGGHNISWLGRKLGIGETPVRNRAKRMRRDGVYLPELAKYGSSRASRLNSILERKLNQDG